MKVLLIAPPIEDFFFTPQRAYPLGLLALAAPLVGDGCDVRVLNALEAGSRVTIPVPKELAYLQRYYQPNKSPFCLFSHYYRFGAGDEAIEKAIREYMPDAVGISANFSAYAACALAVAGCVKRIDSRIPVIVGGRAATATPGLFLTASAVDFVVRGEAEEVFRKLCIALLTVRSLPRAGVCYKKRDSLCITQPATIADLDALPAPAHQLVCRAAYRYNGIPSASLITSRGCARACRFCAIGERFRVRSAQSVIAEIGACYDLGVRHFNFEDDNINYNPSLEAIVDALIDRFPKVKISFMNGLLSHKLGLRLRTKLIAAGLTHLDFSLISSKKSLRRAVSRLESPKRIFSLARSFASSGLDATVHFIVGLPRERFRDALADLRLLSAQPVRLGQSIFYPVIESPLFGELEDVFGIKESDGALFRSSAAFFDKALTRDELFTIFYYSRIINFIKELMDTRALGIRSFAALIARAYQDFVSHDHLAPAGSLSREALGVGLLAILFTQGVVCRAYSAPGGYRLQKEDFIDPETTRSFFSGLDVCSCRLRSIRLPAVRRPPCKKKKGTSSDVPFFMMTSGD